MRIGWDNPDYAGMIRLSHFLLIARRGSLSHRSVILGIRPEDLREHPGDAVLPRKAALPLDIRVVAIEALGPEVILIAALPGGPEIAARMGRAFSAHIGSTQRVFDPATIHLFDPPPPRPSGRGPPGPNSNLAARVTMWLFRVADQLWMVFSFPNSAMTDQPAVFISCSHVDREWKDRFVRHLNVSPDLWGTISLRWMPGLFPERTT